MEIWRCELFLDLGVLLRTYGSRLFLRDSAVVVVLVVSSELQEVIRSRDPKWNVGEVVAIVLH